MDQSIVTSPTRGRGRTLRRRSAALVGIVGIAAAVASCTPIKTGHVDVLDVDYEGGALTLDVRNDTVSPVNDDTDPASVNLHAVPASQTTVPSGSQWSFLGPAGSPVWVLPQVQRADLLWPGWSTEDIGSGVLQNNRVNLRLVSVDGPGQFTLYTVNSFGTPTVLYNTANGLPDSMAVNTGAHVHANWAFRAAGTYTMTFEATATTTGGAALSSGLVDYTFVVEA